MLFTVHCYHVVALYIVGEEVEEGESLTDAEKEAEVRVQLVLCGTVQVSLFVSHLQSQDCGLELLTAF